MRIFTVAERLKFGSRSAEGLRQCRLVLCGSLGKLGRKIRGNGRVVGSRMLEGSQCGLLPKLQGHSAVLLPELRAVGVVLMGIRQNGQMGVVFGRRAHHSRASDVNVLDRIL